MNKLIVCLALMALPLGAIADVAPPAKEVTCRACHGAKGEVPIMGAYPKLNGQNKDYLISALKAYRAGSRTGGMSIVMTGQAKMLSDADITALSEYYAAQK